MENLNSDALEKVFEFFDYKSRAQVRGTSEAIKSAVDQVGLAVIIDEKNGKITGLDGVKIKEAVISKMDDPGIYNFHSTNTIIFKNLIKGNFFLEQLTALPKLTSLVLFQKALTGTDFDIKCKADKVPEFQHLKFLSIKLSEHDLPAKMNPYLSGAITKRLDNNMKVLMENIYSRVLKTIEIKLEIFNHDVKFTWDRCPLEGFMNKHKSTLEKAYLTHPTENPDFSKKIKLKSLFLIGVNEFYEVEHRTLSKLATSQNKLEEFGCAELKFHQSQSVENLYKSILDKNFATLKYFNVEIASDNCKFQPFDFGCFETLTSLKCLRYKRGMPWLAQGINRIPESVEYLTLDGFKFTIDAEMFQFLDEHQDLKELKLFHKINLDQNKSTTGANADLKLFLQKILHHRSLCQVEIQFWHFPTKSSFLNSDSIASLGPWMNPENVGGSGASGDKLVQKLRIVELTMAPYTLPTNSAKHCVYKIQPNPLTDYFDEETGHKYEAQYDEISELSSYMSGFQLAGPKIQPHVPESSANSFTMLKNSKTGTTKIIPHYKPLTARFSNMDNFKTRILFDVDKSEQLAIGKVLKEYGGAGGDCDIGFMDAKFQF